MIGSLPPDVTFCKMFADLIPAPISTFWDTENYPGILPSVAFIVIRNFLFLDMYSI